MYVALPFACDSSIHQSLAAMTSWKDLKPLHKGLLMALVISSIVGIFVGVTLSRSSRDTERPNFNSNEKSIDIVGNLNDSVDPCDDFYEFACGKFKTRHTRDKDTAAISYFTIQSDQIERDILRLLMADIPRYNQTGPEAYMRTLYKKCIDDVTDEPEELNKLRRKIESVFTESSSLTRRMATVARMGISSIVSIGVVSNPFETSKQSITIDFPTIASPVLETLFDSFADKAFPSDDPVVEYIGRSLKLLENVTDDKKDDDYVKTVNQIRDSIRVIMSMRTVKPAKSITESIHQVTLAQLDDTGFPWSELIQMILDRSVDPSETVIVGDLEYVMKVASIVKEHESSIEPYLRWAMLQTHGIYTGREFRDIMFDFLRKSKSQPINRQEFIDQRCRQLLEGEILGRMYVDKFITREDKDNVTQLTQKVAESFKELIMNKEWMDEATKAKALVKLENIVKNIGYPDWILNDEELEKEFPFLSKGNLSDFAGAYELASSMTDAIAVRKFNTVGKEIDLDHEWPISPVLINAVYSVFLNTITIPASLLRGTFFSKDYPDYVNFGQLGSIIGHELTHAFDVKGSDFDEHGSINNWWSDETRKQYDERAKCMIDQYSEIKIPLPYGEAILDGNLTIGENIADNGGMREAFNAWTRYHSKASETPLKGLDKFTPEQLFFISYANTWCGDYSDDYLSTQVLFDAHSPAKYRVNVPLSNFKEFASAFNCPPESKMNPKTKCEVW